MANRATAMSRKSWKKNLLINREMANFKDNLNIKRKNQVFGVTIKTRSNFHLVTGGAKWRLGLAALILMACASEGFPPGGPEDKRPPEILSVVPANDSVEVALNTDVIIEFSERMDKNSVEESIFISPYPGGALKFQWRGKRLKIRFPEPLKPDRTYVITIGTGSKDLRNNPLIRSQSLAFATGKKLDSCSLSGQIFADTRIQGTQIWAYVFNDSAGPNPRTQFADYITQADGEGRYQFSYLARTAFRVFAVNDRDVNQLYDPEYDALGVTVQDVVFLLDSTLIQNINFRLSVRDTTAPFLESATAPDQFHVDLRFSEALGETGVTDFRNYRITAGPDTLSIFHIYQNSRNPSYIHLLTEAQAEKSYQVTAGGLKDMNGHALVQTAEPVEFAGSIRPDSTGPKILFTEPTDSSFGIPTRSALTLTFSEAMDTASVKIRFSLRDSSDKAVPGRWYWSNLALGKYTPEPELVSKMSYRAVLNIDSVYDYHGNSLADTSLSLRFVTFNADTLSAISGTLSDADTLADGQFYLEIKSADGKNSYNRWLDQSGPFSFDAIMPGIYLLRAFRDQDKNGQFSWGEPFPFVPAERYFQFPDSIKVRSRWTNEGNDFILPK